MMKRTTLCFFCGAVLLLLSHNAAAQYAFDLAPDWRGQSGTTVQQWDFIEGVPAETAISPDSENFFNPNATGNNPVQLIYYPGSTSSWEQGTQPHEGVLPLSGSIQIDIPNYPNSNPYKDIVVQLVWAPETPRGKPTIEVLPDHQDFGEFGTLVETAELDGEWQYSKYLVHLEPNPDFEQVWIDGSVIVDSIIIDTICMPEPATLLLVGLGGLVLRKRRKVQKM